MNVQCSTLSSIAALSRKVKMNVAKSLIAAATLTRGVLGAAALALLSAPSFADAALNSEVTQSTINDTICAPGYSYTVRPPWYLSAKLKLQLLKARGESWFDAPKYELDHIIPLCLGGSATDPSNLQLQAWDEAYRKDRLEIQAMRCVCAGKVSLEDAQHDLATDWEAVYHRYAKLLCRRPTAN